MSIVSNFLGDNKLKVEVLCFSEGVGCEAHNSFIVLEAHFVKFLIWFLF